MKPVVYALALSLALAACNSAPEQTSDSSAAPAANTTSATNALSAAGNAVAVADASAPPAAAATCVACHKFGKDDINTVGPKLFGVVGRKAGTVEGYAYSDAMKSSGITWDEAKLDAYLTNPATFMPNNKMPFAGIADAAARKQVVDYLASLK